MVKSVLQLKCQCNNYPWGKKGSASRAAQLCAETPGTDFGIDEEKYYAEMWMGTYPELPSYVLESGEDLQDVINANTHQLLGESVYQSFGNDLPFLPKVLSIAKALPLQLHPNKTLASKLHNRNPEKFTDSNHKPEIALALGPFEAFVGWKPLLDIADLLMLEPLQQFLNGLAKKRDFDDQMLKGVCENMLKADEETVASVGEALKQLPKEKFGKHDYIPDLLPRLWNQYDKTDNGTLVAAITMEYMKLDAGDAIYVPADSIHAYLSGDIIECMARSNNVLNTGFCPRADRDDIDTFVETLTFTPHDRNEAILKPQPSKLSRKTKTKLYAPPMAEFNMLSTEVEKGESEVISKINGPSIMIVTKGKGSMKADGDEYALSEGYIFFVGAGIETEYVADEDLQIFRAYAE